MFLFLQKTVWVDVHFVHLVQSLCIFCEDYPGQKEFSPSTWLLPCGSLISLIPFPNLLSLSPHPTILYRSSIIPFGQHNHIVIFHFNPSVPSKLHKAGHNISGKIVGLKSVVLASYPESCATKKLTASSPAHKTLESQQYASQCNATLNKNQTWMILYRFQSN